MKFRSLLSGVIAVAGVAVMPSAARAATDPCLGAGYSATLGLGGFLSGCFQGTLWELGEDAFLESDQFYWNGTFAGASGITSNDPILVGVHMFTDECGSTGGGVFAFCPAPPDPGSKSTSQFDNLSGELVIGLNVPDEVTTGFPGGFYWIYSGCQLATPALTSACEFARNGVPSPSGFQSVLMQLTLGGSDDPGQYLFAWEDINSGCQSESPPVTRFAEEDLGNGPLLDSHLHNCGSSTGGLADNDYNDSYIRFAIVGTLDVVPEPMTMSLMAVGLLGLGGASLRRRKKN